MTSNVYVIKNQKGHFIAPKQNKDGWSYLCYTGRCTGFTFYSNKKTAQEELRILNGLGYNYYLESISNINSIPKGELIIENTYENIGNCG